MFELVFRQFLNQFLNISVTNVRTFEIEDEKKILHESRLGCKIIQLLWGFNS